MMARLTDAAEQRLRQPARFRARRKPSEAHDDEDGNGSLSGAHGGVFPGPGPGQTQERGRQNLRRHDLHIWDAKDLEKVNKAAVAQKVDLGGAAAALCMTQTGANPVRPHMLTMNDAATHAIVSFVASGHVLFMDARTRQPITCIRTSFGSTGIHQVHQSFPSPDETYVAVANQNGKLYERINTNLTGL